MKFKSTGFTVYLPPLSVVIVFSILDEVLYTGLIEMQELDASWYDLFF